MRKLAIFLLCVSLFSCSRQDLVRIEGEMSHGKGRTLYLSLLTNEGMQTLDSLKLRRDRFRFTVQPHTIEQYGMDSYPAFYQLSFGPENAFSTLVGPGQTVDIKADANQLVSTYRVSGPEDALLMWELDSALAAFARYTDTLLQVYNYYMDDDSVRSKVEQRYNRLVEDHKRYLRTFIAQHPHSFSTMIAFYQGYNNRRFFDEQQDADLLRSLTDSLSMCYPNSQYVSYLYSRIK